MGPIEQQRSMGLLFFLRESVAMNDTKDIDMGRRKAVRTAAIATAGLVHARAIA